MADTLSKLAKPEGATRPKTRVGRGVGSGLGKTSGRGQKGQYARTRGFKPHFEGGQTPIQRRLPKRGFKNPFAARIAEVNVGDLEIFTAGAKIDEQALTGEQRPRHLVAEAPSEFPVPEYGAHDLEPPNNPAIWQPPALVRGE